MSIYYNPKIVSVTIQWIDNGGEEHLVKYSENTLEEALDIIGLMTGDISEEDLKP